MDLKYNHWESLKLRSLYVCFSAIYLEKSSLFSQDFDHDDELSETRYMRKYSFQWYEKVRDFLYSMKA
jgi:hypothetical protein